MEREGEKTSPLLRILFLAVAFRLSGGGLLNPKLSGDDIPAPAGCSRRRAAKDNNESFQRNCGLEENDASSYMEVNLRGCQFHFLRPSLLSFVHSEFLMQNHSLDRV